MNYETASGQRPKQVKLYYLGGISNPKRKTTLVSSYGRVFALPPVGKALVVDDFIAVDLINRNKVGDKETKQVYECFTLDGRIAQRVANGEDIHAPVMSREQMMESLSDEELEALIEQRGKKVAKTRKRKAQVDLVPQQDESQLNNEGDF